MKPVYYFLFIILSFACSCTPFKISVSDDLKKDHDEYTVKGATGSFINQKLSFGEYKTARVKRSWIKGTSELNGFGFGYPGTENYTNIISTEYIHRKQTIFFSLADPHQKASEVYCSSRFDAKEFTLGRRENSLLNIVLDIFGNGYSEEDKYYVQIYTAENEKPWQMMIDNHAAQAQAKTYIGVLAKDKEHFYTLVPIRKVERKGKEGIMPFGSIGFEFRDPENRAVAAVTSMERGMVFLGKTNDDERFLLANACAALLLQQMIGE